MDGISLAFSEPTNDPDVLFYLPVTKQWLYQFILCLILNCKACYMGIAKTMEDCFDYSISIGTIHNVMDVAST